MLISFQYQYERGERMQTTIRLTEELHSQIKKVAEERGISINAVVTLALWEHLKRMGG